MRSLTDTESAYLAGLLDGEGHFSFTRRYKPTRKYKRYYFEFRIILVMTSKALMDDIAILVPFGGGSVSENKRKLGARSKPSYRLGWHGKSAVNLCRSIYPYIRLKKEHVELMLSLEEEKSKAQDERSGTGLAYPKRIHELQETLAKRFRVINQRGVISAC